MEIKLNDSYVPFLRAAIMNKDESDLVQIYESTCEKFKNAVSDEDITINYLGRKIKLLNDNKVKFFAVSFMQLTQPSIISAALGDGLYLKLNKMGNMLQYNDVLNKDVWHIMEDIKFEEVQ